jgi:hypothetical protein
MPGQQLTYAISVRNYDMGCSSSSFAVSVSAPSGFSVSLPTNTITLKSYSSGYVWAYITSPNPIADGDYPITVTVQRVGGSDSTAPATTYYKVYSSDTTAPELFWWNPGEGQTITGRSYGVTVTSKDDHAVRKIDLYMDGAFMSTQSCDNVTYLCQLSYTWSATAGQHTATFRSTDWMGNVGVQTVHFTVG